MAALALLLLLAGRPAEAARGVLKPSSGWRRFQVEVAGGEAVFRYAQVAGCRYRLTAEAGTLPRPILRLGRAGEAPLVRVDAGAAGTSAVHVYRAEADAVMEVRIGGVSAQTGKGRVRLEVLGPGDVPVRLHRRFLAPGGERAAVGELLVREVNRWDLVVEEGQAYVVTPTRGSAGAVRLKILDWDGQVLADSSKGAVGWLALPPVRFRVPPRPPPAAEGKAPGKRAKGGRRAMRLEVRALLEGGGTYGVKLRRLGPEEKVAPAPVPPPAPIEPGIVEGVRTTFRAGPGDLAIVYVPRSPQRTQRVEMRRGERWVHLEDGGLGGSARSLEHALIAWYRPYYPGTYRFRPVPFPPPSAPQLTLHRRAALGSAPIHMGTGVDPTVRARLGSSWTLVGLGVCMPGWDYIFVCVNGPEQGVAMRVRTAAGKVLRTRSAAARTISPGLGPSMRFQVKEPGVVRLEAKNARHRIVRPLLRRAQD